MASDPEVKARLEQFKAYFPRPPKPRKAAQAVEVEIKVRFDDGTNELMRFSGPIFLACPRDEKMILDGYRAAITSKPWR
jgi:hypothetical protein